MSYQKPMTAGPALQMNQYQTGLCDCFQDGKICLDGWCCIWCQAGYQANKFEKGIGGEMDVLVCCGTLCLDLFCCRGMAIACYTGLVGRPAVNRRFGIPEGTAAACLKGFCCDQCSTCQQQREMKMRNFAAGGVCDDTVHQGPPLGAPTYPAIPMAPPIPGQYA